MLDKPKESKRFDNIALDMISKLVKNIKFGTVTVIIQDGKIVQIESNEKFRL